MELQQWVKQVGGVKKAEQELGIKARTLNSWMWGERKPCSLSADKIIKGSNGLVNYNDLYSVKM